MFVSTVIPILNVERCIERCLFSIDSQAYKNMEVVLVNDCTPDNSMYLVDLFLENNPIGNVKIINHLVNRGLSRGRNSGIRPRTGDYIFFLDSGDESQIDGKQLTGHFFLEMFFL